MNFSFIRNRNQAGIVELSKQFDATDIQVNYNPPIKVYCVGGTRHRLLSYVSVFKYSIEYWHMREETLTLKSKNSRIYVEKCSLH